MPTLQHSVKNTVLAGTLLALSACSSGGASGDDPICGIEPMRNWVQDNMQDYYLFYDQVPQINLSNYSDIENLITDLRVAPYDRYSYIGDEALSTALFEEGKRFGFGMRLTRTASNELRFTLLNPGSPLDIAGVIRGERLLAINGIAIDSPQLTAEFLDSALGTGDTVVTTTFSVESVSGQSRDVTVTKTMFDVDTVLQTDVRQVGSATVGYLHFYSFLETSTDDLNTAFGTFKEADINELVLDLRYNGGGRISVANELASKIVGASALGSDFTYFSFNRKYSSNNQGFEFIEDLNALGLNRVFVLTTDDTCSASELVINGLRPFIEVITVGDTSCGKPYGTSARTRCGKVMHALEVEFVNNSRVGGYFAGISADCPAIDNVFQMPGDKSENLMASALSYIEYGSCPLVAGRTTAPSATRHLENPTNAEKRHLLR